MKKLSNNLNSNINNKNAIQRRFKTMNQDRQTELIIQIDTKLKNICQTNKEIKESINDIYDKIDSFKENYTTRKLFFWAAGIIIFCIIGLIGFSSSISDRSIRNEVIIETLGEKSK